MSLLPKGSTDGLTEKSVQPKGARKFYVGAAWDGNVDLDLMIVPVAGGSVDSNSVCYFNNLTPFNGAIKHSGDALDGDADGDDESVVICTDSLPADVDHLAIGVIAYNVNDMSDASNTQFTVRDGESETAPELYTLPMADDDTDGETILVACILSRSGDGFTITNVGDFRTDFGKGMDAVNGLVKIAPSYT